MQAAVVFIYLCELGLSSGFIPWFSDGSCMFSSGLSVYVVVAAVSKTSQRPCRVLQ